MRNHMTCGVIPSLRSNWWCYPTSRVFFYIFGVIVCDCLWFYYSRVLLYFQVKSITSGIRDLSRAKWRICFLNLGVLARWTQIWNYFLHILHPNFHNWLGKSPPNIFLQISCIHQNNIPHIARESALISLVTFLTWKYIISLNSNSSITFIP